MEIDHSGKTDSLTKIAETNPSREQAISLHDGCMDLLRDHGQDSLWRGVKIVRFAQNVNIEEGQISVSIFRQFEDKKGKKPVDGVVMDIGMRTGGNEKVRLKLLKDGEANWVYPNREHGILSGTSFVESPTKKDIELHLEALELAKKQLEMPANVAA